jgi:hypothetical protein
VTARIVTWSADKALKVPSSALFRCERARCVCAIPHGRTQRRTVEVGWQVRQTSAPDGVVNLRVATMPDKLNAELTGWRSIIPFWATPPPIDEC